MHSNLTTVSFLAYQINFSLFVPEDVLPKLEVPEMKQLPVEPKQPPSRPKAGPKRPSAGPVIPTPSADKGQGMSQPAKQMGRRGAGARPKVPAQGTFI